MKAPQNKLKLKLSTLPALPGVYQFLNRDGAVIYVGKAKNLKSRVSQYFSGHDRRPQLPYLMREAADLKYTVTASELESLFLENTLIKQYLPRYNIMLRDDKNYAFIKIDYSAQIPQIGYARKIDPADKKNKFFGPYSAAHKIRSTLNLVRKIFPFCANKTVGSRPCFYYYLHRCPGVCVGRVSLEEYQKQIDRICWFLAGNAAKIKSQLKAEMKLAAKQKRFEAAARLRDQLQALSLLDERQNAVLPQPVDWDVISLFASDGYSCINLFKIRLGKLQDKENFVYETSYKSANESNPANNRGLEVTQKFLEQYYLESSSLPKIIYLQASAENPELIGQISRSRFNKSVKIICPQKGKPLELLRLGGANAEQYLKNWLQSQAGHLDKINAALKELKSRLNLQDIPDRMECYDISNIQGTNAVGSMAVFEKGLPAKSQYRKFKIHGKQTPDDFAMMKEMLARRLERSLGNDKNRWPLPDLMVIDGGKGQLAVAVAALRDKNIRVPVIGLAKRIEEIFFPDNPEPLVLPHENAGLQLLQRLRDETHRFGITFHRQLRSRQAVKSVLDGIPGIGPRTKKILKQKFGTVAKIRTAPFEQLKEAVGEHLAKLIQQNL